MAFQHRIIGVVASDLLKAFQKSRNQNSIDPSTGLAALGMTMSTDFLGGGYGGGGRNAGTGLPQQGRDRHNRDWAATVMQVSGFSTVNG